MTSSVPLVSAVIPVYNGEKFLAETIESVLGQTYQNIECLVVNDGSTDNTAAVAGAFGDRIRYFEKSNGGVSSARNLGIGEALGEYIAYLDADDIWLPTKIEEQIAFLRQHNDIGLLFCGSYNVDEAGRKLSKNEVLSHDELLKQILLLGPATGRIPSTGIAPKRVHDIVGEFDEQLSTSADADFMIRLAQEAAVVGLPQPLACYRVHGGQMHHNLNALEHDMNIVLQKAFSMEDLPEWMQRLRSKAYSSLESTLAVGHLSGGRYRKALHHIGKAIKYHPATFVGSFARVAAAKVVS